MSTQQHDPVRKQVPGQWLRWGRWLGLSLIGCSTVLGSTASPASARFGEETETADTSVTVVNIAPWQPSGMTGQAGTMPTARTAAPVVTPAALPAALPPVPARPATISVPAPASTAQTPTSTDNVQPLQDRLQAYQKVNSFGNVFEGSPAITIANPSGYGADGSTAFVSASFQARTRFTQQADGGLAFGYGFGDSVNTVGAEVSYTLASFGTGGRDFGTGGFNAKIHRQLPGEFAIAVGWNGFIVTGNRFNEDFKDSIYGVVTKIIRVQDDINEPFSRIALSAGFGSGQFRSESDIRNRINSVSPFGSIALRIAQPVSAVVEWTGQDLAAGVSFVPIQGVNWSITPGVRDITGAGDGARFVLGTAFSIQF